MTGRPRFARRASVIVVLIGVIAAVAATPANAAAVTATLVQTIRTSDMTPPSPDPSGITYNPETNRLIFSDSEVEETPLYAQVSVWEITSNGSQVRQWRAPTIEPTGLALDVSAMRMFFTDDDADRVYIRRAGTDRVFATSDDSLTSFSVGAYSTDPEDIAYDPATGDVYLSDGVGKEVYHVARGSDNTFGTADDVVSHFDVGTYGEGDPEGIDYDPVRGTLFQLDYVSEKVYELSKSGSLLNTIDVSAANATLSADVALAPASNGSGTNLWIVARGVDNNDDPNENDGRLYEMSFTLPGGTNTAPTVSITSPANGSSFVQGTSVQFTGSASDTEDGNLTSGLVWTSNLSGQIGTGGSFSTSSLAVGTHTITASVTDTGGLTGSATRTVTITAAPPANTAPTVSITSPTNNATFLAGTPVQFTGTATDTEQGDLTGSLVWTSNLSGQIGTGGSFTSSSLALGTHTITARVTDNGGLQGAATRTITITDTATIAVPVATGRDDAEQHADGVVDLTSSDLELVQDASTQTVGLRFAGVGIPPGATIESSYVQFNVDETGSTATTLQLRAQDAANPGTFTTEANNVSSRATFGTAVSWTPAAWTKVNQHGVDQRTPSLNALLQLAVNRSGWASGNAVVLIVSGSGKRVADSFEGGSSRRPVLNVTYRVGGSPPPANTAPTVAISSPANNASFTQGAPVTFTGSATDTQDGNLTSSLVWTSNLDGQIGTGGSFTTSSLSAGTHTVTASATDTGNLTGSATRTVIVTTPPSNTAPSVSISSPANGTSVTQGTPVTFTGSASDSQDGNLTSSLVWTSNLDGQIGTGGSFTTSSLSVGTHTVTASATDSGNLTGSATRTVTITGGGGGVQTLNIPIAAATDDAEEYASGAMVLDSTDLEMVQESSTQKVGMRFANAAIPAGATIVTAYVQFTVDEVSTAATSLTIRCQAADNAGTFTSSSGNISSRTLTSTSAAWSPVAWNTVDEAGVDQRTPNLNTVIQQVVGRAGWASGNAIVVIVTGSGKRVARAYETSPSLAPVLHIEYTV